MGELLTDFANWLVDALKDVIAWVASLVLDALAVILQAIPVPGWVASGQSAFNAIDPQVWYWLGPFNIPEGVGIILSAYGIRFLIRRIPIFG